MAAKRKGAKKRATMPRTTDPWRAKLLKKTPHALMQLELRADGIVALCHCGWQSKPTTTERKAHNAFARHKAAPHA
jgi:hypothetical protein